MGTRNLLLIMLLLCQWAFPAQAADSRLVVVASAKSSIHDLTTNEVRRAYLGVAVINDGQELLPVRNASDALLKEIFLQKVLFMSANQYERHMVTRVFRGGGERIPEHIDMQQLVNELQADHRKITFMRGDTAAATPGVKIVGELWRGQ